MTQTIIPRPVAWVLSEHENGKYNLAPFSYFNAVCSEPPILSISVGHKKDGFKKDTWLNIELRSHFVVHIPRVHHVHHVLQSAESLPQGESEIDQCGLDLADFDGLPLPRLATAPIAYYCKKYDIVPLGVGPQALILGEIYKVYLAEDIITGTNASRVPEISSNAINPLARLGANGFAKIEEFKVD